MTPRWPLHPQPGPLEALSSWLTRIAGLYHLPVAELLTGNLGLVDLAVPDDLDLDPPAAMLAALSDRTGVDLARIWAMTLAGWRPWLLDTLDAEDKQATFDNYVRGHSVLLTPRSGAGNGLDRYRLWRGPWLPQRRRNRTCPVCAAMPDRGRPLLGRLPLMVSCGEHGCRLEDATTVDIEMALHDQPPAPAPVAEPVATLDRYTHQALLTGRVSLPGRSARKARVLIRTRRGGRTGRVRRRDPAQFGAGDRRRASAARVALLLHRQRVPLDQVVRRPRAGNRQETPGCGPGSCPHPASWHPRTPGVPRPRNPG